ncbi:lamin tail domain-containing protein [Chloroflexota bacterium]
MTRKQMLFVLVANALISTLISVGVALLLIRSTQVAPIAAIHTVVVAATQVPVDNTQVVEPTAAAESAMLTPTPIVYVVQPGDTLSSLALKFDVPAADIMAANRIQNADFLQAGVELTIPIGGLPQATATWTAIPTVTDTPIPFEPPSASLTATASVGEIALGSATATSLPTAGELLIEIAEILDAGIVEQERVVITNVGERLADMQGWTLNDADENTYVFPNYRLWAGGSLTVHTRPGQDGNPLSSLFWGKLEAVWSLGEVASLKNAEGEVIATHAVGP